MYCSAPWTTVQIKNDGQFSYCCMSRDPMGDTLNDSKLVNGREKMINGEILPVCQTKCFDIEKMFSSQRQDLNRRWPIKNPVDPIANPEHIDYIDLRMGNICNYTCLMCGDRDSHIWGKINGKENPYISWARDSMQYQRIMDFIASCKNLKCISLAGGEPFYNKKQLFDVIDRLDRNIELKFITNMSFCDDEIISKLNEFKKGRLHCSIDGVDKWIEVQRLRSEWNLVNNNVLKFAKELHENWELRLVPTFTVLNTHGLLNFIDWFHNKLQIIRPNTSFFSYTICTAPDYMTLYNIPLDTRIAIVQEIKRQNFPKNVNIDRLLETLTIDKKPNADTKLRLKKYLNYVEQKIGLDVVKEIPEIGDIIG